MAVLLALASAACYGSADFLGGLGSKRANTIAVVAVSQLAGLAALLIMLPLLPAATPSRTDFLWGAAAGLTGGVGVAFLYRALAVGRMAVVAPTTAICAVVIPVAAAMMLGERPAPLTMAGIGLAIVAILLVSHQPAPADAHEARARRRIPPGFGLALLSGVGIGLFFLSLAQTSRDGGLWPLVSSRLLSVLAFGGVAIGAGTLTSIRPVIATVIGGGVLDMLANALYLMATRSGPLAIVVTLSSLYPASTVILARVVLGERLSRWQVAGIVCATIAVSLIVATARS